MDSQPVVVRRLEQRLRERITDTLRIVLPEVSRVVIEGARIFVSEYGGTVLFVGDEAAIRAGAEGLGWTLPAQVEIADSRASRLGAMETALELVGEGAADGIVAGAVLESADVLRAALSRLRVGDRWSGQGVVLVTMGGRVMVFADCTVMLDPDADRLAAMACDVADAFERLVGERPCIAMLSYKTNAGTSDPDVAKMRRAAELVRLLRPDLRVDGELQFDAAFDTGVARIKAPNSAVAGHANTFIFPDLASANIGYKIAQYAGGAEFLFVFATAVHPPVINLSRGATPRVVARSLAACAVLAALGKERALQAGTTASRA
ncbi:MAG: phosphate acyltransferase [Gaiellaceae bacterium]